LPLSTDRAPGGRAAAPYPETPAARDRWILERRGTRNPVDPSRPVGAFVEEERTERGESEPVATLFLANRECPWRCLMCDLWKNTTTETVRRGSIPLQIRSALGALPPVRRVKLYNAGSFFDPRAIPSGDLGEIAAAVDACDRVIVESHPALVAGNSRRFQDLLAGDLEVAMGLETVHPVALPLLNKRMGLDDFRRAADGLAKNGIAMRAFVLLGLPFVPAAEAVLWAVRSTEFAFDAGATAVSIIPTRAGNGALDSIAARGEFDPPSLDALEQAAAEGIAGARGRVFADLWNLESLCRCVSCFPARSARLATMNREQRVPPPVACAKCGAGA
jgi:archaeosine synthase beta-subunit